MKTTVGLVLYSLLLTSCKLTNTMPDRQLVKRKTIKNEASQDQSSRENRANDNPDVAEVSAGDAASVEELFQEFTEGSALPGTFTLSKPVNWQVFQRKNATEGDLSFEISEAITSARFLRARLLKNGQAINDNWQMFRLPNGVATADRFSFAAPAGGWYRLEVIAYDQNRKILARQLIDQIGVGEVFLVSGQSNSSNCGAPAQTSQSGMVASTNGQIWQSGSDPQIGAADGYIPFCLNGSNWPRTGDRLFEKYQVPVAFAITGHSGTTVADWQPGVNFNRAGAPPVLYDHLSRRAQQLGKGGFRAVLWHQGENDTVAATSSDQYYQRMLNIMAQLETDLGDNGIRWGVAQASWCKDGTYPSVNNGIWGESAAVRAAQARLWLLDKVFEGPDTDQLKDDQFRRLVGPERRDCHFSGLGLQTVGDMWFEKISVMLDTLLAAE